ncbi:MAG: DUF3078 domain-containing protein [Bacteroidales bacterium]|nr:DUF3078 domain-containing protein [Bacteroidales bacterium]
MNKHRFFTTILLAMIVAAAAGAQSSTSTQVKPGKLMLPLVFDKQTVVADTLKTPSIAPEKNASPDLNYDRSWLDDEIADRDRVEKARYRTMLKSPATVPYNASNMREAPKEHVVTAKPSTNLLTIDTPKGDEEVLEMPEFEDRRDIKRRNWLHTVQSSLHFTQAYISENWYQGGENNVNVLGDFQWNVSLNQKLHPKFLFDNTLRYKVGVMSAQSDSLRKYAINQDVFQFNSTFGYKAIKNWYYSTSLQFKTQLFKTYQSNTRNLKSALLSPAELNIGLGMTYNYKDKEGIKTLALSIAPLSYNMKYCRDIEQLNPVDFGIDAGKHFAHSFGSKLEAKLNWKLSANISWASRFYVYSNYEYVQGDWENTVDFSITRHLSTKIFVHVRYDKSRPYNESWKYWQLKEILSFGLTYRFATTN